MSESAPKVTETAFKCGYVALCGAPNVGKSTLLNRLVADKVAITSPKPQTTRHRLLGVVNLSRAQILFLDAPGLMDPKGLLNENLVRAAVSALNDADVVVWIVTPQEHEAEREVILSHLRLLTKPLIIAINKIDTIPKPEILPLIQRYHSLKPEAPVVPIAALLGDGLPNLMSEIIDRLPASPPLYPTDLLTDQTERFLAAEFIRERVFHHTSQEIPYAAAVKIEEFNEAGAAAPDKDSRRHLRGTGFPKGHYYRQKGQHAENHRPGGPGGDGETFGLQSFPGTLGQSLEELA